MDLTFIRHGEQEPSDLGEIATDPDLSPRGVQQAQRLAQSASRWKPAPTEIMVSPMGRARQTAAPLCELLGTEPTVMPWLAEIRVPHGGLADMAAGAPLVEGAESLSDFRTRVIDGLTALLAERGCEPVGDERPPKRWKVPDESHRLVLVAHGGTNAIAVEWLLGIDNVPWYFFRLQFRHTAIARLKAYQIGDAWVLGLLRLNHAPHLSAGLQGY